jgi:protein TonB
MGQQLFAGSLVRTQARAGAAVPVSMALHVVVVGGLLVLPLMAGGDPPPAAAPAPVIDTIVLTILPVPVAHVLTLAPRRASNPARAERAPTPSHADAPATVSVPLRLDPPSLSDLVGDVDACVGCALSDGTGGGTPDGNGGGGDPDGSGTGSAPLVVGIHVSAPAKLRHVDPEYPELARRAGVQGTVVIECVIDASGRVDRTRVVRGIPVLDAAALAAVRQWSYRPTLVNGVAVPVVMTVTVQFHLR